MCLIPSKRNVKSAIAVFIFVFIYEWLLHGKLLAGQYQGTAHLWRTPDDFADFYPYMLLLQFVFSLWLATLFDKNYENKGVDEGIRFGTLIGTGLAIITLGWYVVLPVSSDLGITWALGAFVEGLGVGYVLSKVHGKAKVAAVAPKAIVVAKKKKKR